MKRTGLPLPILSLFLLAGAAVSGENPGAHQHGHAELSFAIDGDRVELMFSSPAYNVVGFEHEARTEPQTRALREASEWLARTSLLNTPDNTCTVIKADVHNSGRQHKEEHGNDGEGHSAFEVVQTLDCPGIQSTKTLTTPLTGQLERLEHLDVQWAGATSQGATRLERGEGTIELRR
ncbi:DUF2796 domain-containing protein [Marinobacter pelagius]|uniref:ZrgA family zinc uptake protein n=1 Tax=Marinobacter sp. C7 TaxID=2951363 RepID=UPI001EF0FB0C|nr:DUF2796 domain-containing protein [Marinobacter sp. C7]MCG7198332.1 DUF2796 domain-containing protein [Marinobacter sp. C7]